MNFSEAQSCEIALKAILEALACDEGLSKQQILELAEDAKTGYIAVCKVMDVSPDKTYL